MIYLVLISPKFMELFLTDDVNICPIMIDSFEDIVRKSRSRLDIIFIIKISFLLDV
jgi:hypothetical protein